MDGGHLVLAAKGGGIVFAGRLFVWGSRFVLAVLLARLLGAELYGQYNIALTVATLAAALSVIGLDAALIRYVAIFRSRGDQPGLRGSLQLGLGIPLIVSLAVALGVVIAADPIAIELIGEPAIAPLLRIVGILVPAMVLNSLLSAALRGMNAIGSSVLAEQFAQPVVRFIVLVAFALMGMTPGLALLASTLATIAATLLLAWFLHRNVRLGGLAAPARREPASLLRFSLPVYFSNVVHTFGDNLQVLLLGTMASIASAGIFAVAAHVNLVGTLFHSAVVASSMPLFAELHDRGAHGRLEHLYQTTSKWTFTLNLPFFLIVLLFADEVLAIFGPEFTSGAPALVILAVAAIANAGTGTSGAVLDMSGHTVWKLVNTTASVGLAIVLNLLLIPSLGVVGAAIAMLGSVSAVNLLRVAEVRWLVGVQPYNAAYLKPLVAGAVAGLAALGISLLLAPVNQYLAAAFGAAVLVAIYGGLLVRLGLSEDDRMILGRAANRFRRRGAGQKREPAQTDVEGNRARAKVEAERRQLGAEPPQLP